MLQPLSKAQRAWSTFIVVTAFLAAFLHWDEARLTHQTVRPDVNRAEAVSVVNNNIGPSDSSPQKQQLSGEPAQR